MPRPDFRWNAWNVGHIADHGVTPQEAEWVVAHARAPWPRQAGDGKYLVWGRTADGRYLQVVFVRDAGAPTVYVIHARPLAGPERRRARRRGG